MKIIIIIFSLISINVNAQTKVKPKIDSVKADTTYSILLKKEEIQWIINLIKSQDEKPSIINNEVNALLSKTNLEVKK